MIFQNNARFSAFAHAALRMILIALFVAGAGVVRAESSSSVPQGGNKTFSLALQPCHLPKIKDEVRCGIYNVPENRAVHGGRMLPLRIMVLPARSRQPDQAPVFYFEGGPGEPATASAPYLMDSGIRDRHDIVLIDQRGTGEGHRLDCPRPDSGKDIQVYLEPLYVIRGCARELAKHADLTQYATPTAMQDIDEIRQALGYDKVVVYGGSYGSRAAMIYTRMFGQHVQAGILEAVAPLSLRIPLYFARDSQRAFDRLIAECQSQAACKAAYPDPRADLEAARRKLRQQPARTTIESPLTSAPAEISVTERAFTDAIHAMQYSMEETREIPLALRRAREGNFHKLMENFVQLRYEQAKEIDLGMFMAVECSEDVARIHADEVEQEARGSYFGPGMARDLMASCSEWPMARLPEDYFKPFQSNVPMLLISGDLDPSTPPVWGEEARRSFPHSLHVVLHRAHSGGGDCAGSLERQFLAKLSLEEVDTSCAQSAQNPPFVLPDAAAKAGR